MRDYYKDGRKLVSIRVVLDEDDYGKLTRMAATPSLGVKKLLRERR